MTTKIRIDEDKHIRATVTDQEGGQTFFANAGFTNDGPNFAAISFIEEEGGEPGNFHAIVSGESPGTAIMDFDAVDSFFDNVSAQETFIVVNAIAFQIVLRAQTATEVLVTKTGYKVRILATAAPEIAAEIIPVDEFGLADNNGVPPPTAVYASGLTNIEWRSVNGLFYFDTGGGPGPGPISGVLSLTLNPQVGGDDIIRVSAINSSGAPLSTDVPIRVLNANQVTLTVSET